MPHTHFICLVPASHPFYLPCTCLSPLLSASYLPHTPFTCLIPAWHPFYLPCTCLTPLVPTSYLPCTLVPALHPFYLPCTCLAPLLLASCSPCNLCNCLTSFVSLAPLALSTCLAPLTPLTPLASFILICILKDDWMHCVTPFQNQNVHQSDPCKIGLLIIKVLKAPLFLVPKSPAPSYSMNKLTLMSQQK